MSLTGTSGLFAAVHEDGINDFVQAFFGSRPRYLRIGSSPFVNSTTVSGTHVDAIDIGGGSGAGVQFLIELEMPVLDLHPNTKGFVLPPGPNQFSLQIKARLTIACRKKKGREDDKEPSGQMLTTDLEVCAQGQIIRTGNRLSFVIDNVEIKDIQPDSLESIIECILKMVLNEALDGLRIPYQSIFIQIGTVVPVGGPSISDDQLKVSANFI